MPSVRQPHEPSHLCSASSLSCDVFSHLETPLLNVNALLTSFLGVWHFFSVSSHSWYLYSVSALFWHLFSIWAILWHLMLGCVNVWNTEVSRPNFLWSVMTNVFVNVTYPQPSPLWRLVSPADGDNKVLQLGHWSHWNQLHEGRSRRARRTGRLSFSERWEGNDPEKCQLSHQCLLMCDVD